MKSVFVHRLNTLPKSIADIFPVTGNIVELREIRLDFRRRNSLVHSGNEVLLKLRSLSYLSDCPDIEAMWWIML
eukprot:14543458-Heterocapsa_arctica.AAC.1